MLMLLLNILCTSSGNAGFINMGGARLCVILCVSTFRDEPMQGTWDTESEGHRQIKNKSELV